jgi:transposase
MAGSPTRFPETLAPQGFLTAIRENLALQIQFVCSDVWQPYLKVIPEKCPSALVHDRFQVVAQTNKSLDEMRSPQGPANRPRGSRTAVEEDTLVRA